MLEQLTIRNFAIISGLETRLRPGLNILSGETGAGKSIVVNAVNLILGGRASGDLIRTGTDEARVEALFTAPESSPLAGVLNGLDIPFKNEVLITRTISREGRNTIRINGTMATLQMLSAVSPHLISVSGQHEHQRLLRAENHLYMLDDFAGLSEERAEVTELHLEYTRLRGRLNSLDGEINDMEERRDLARFRMEEIQTANIDPGEDDRLTDERSLLRHGEEIRSAVRNAYQGIYEKDGAVIAEISRLERGLERATELDRRIEPARKALVSARTELEDAALQLRELQGLITLDPFRLEEVEERLQLLNRLKRKYGPTLTDVIRTGEQAARSIDDLEEKRLERKALDSEMTGVEKLLLGRALALSRRRRAASETLKQAVERELSVLAMEGTVFEVRFEGDEELDESGSKGIPAFLGRDGLDRVEFLISPNMGEEVRPLARIASGGELSRIMLAMKTILAGNSSVETVVFDEVDSGIGGSTAEIVGEKLRHLARYHQILCITHLPQIASKGDYHYRVWKEVQGRRTEASISQLGTEDRVREIARLLGGKRMSEMALAHAREMIEGATRD